MHNEACQQALNVNQSRILNINGIHTNLQAAWPSGASDIHSSVSALTTELLAANQQIYDSCVAEGESVRSSQLYALAELKKLANLETNPSWRVYVSALESTLKNVKEIR